MKWFSYLKHNHAVDRTPGKIRGRFAAMLMTGAGHRERYSLSIRNHQL